MTIVLDHSGATTIIIGIRRPCSSVLHLIGCFTPQVHTLVQLSWIPVAFITRQLILWQEPTFLEEQD